MAEAYHIFGNDMVLSGNGDILLVSGPLESLQRVYRRLMTAVQGYLWDLSYGAGLPQQVGKKANAQTIMALIRGQMFMEESVAQTPAPVINVQVYTNGAVLATVQYTEQSSQQQVTLTFTIPSNSITTGSTQ